MTEPAAMRPQMAGYGVPDDTEGVLPWAWAEERLVRNRNYWVVTATSDGRPHSLPVWGVWRPDPTAFVFSCAPTARKARNMAANPQVCVTVDDTVECVSVEGRAAVLSDPAAQDAAIDAYVVKYWEPDKRAEMADFLRQNALWVVRPERAFAIIEREEEFAARATKWVW